MCSPDRLAYASSVEPPSLADRLRAVDPRVFDGLIAVGLAVFAIGSLLAEPTGTALELKQTDGWTIVLALLTTLPVYWRRRNPLPALLVSASAVTVVALLEYRTESLPVAALFLVYAVGAYAPRQHAVVGLLVTEAAIVTIFVSDTPDMDAQGMVLNLVLFGAGWLAGQVVRARNAVTTAKLSEAQERAEAEVQHAARAVAEERLRLAQELHDVVAHSMSVIAVQAGMGVHVLDSQPDDARRALEAISSTSRATLREMRRLLGALRDEDGVRSHAPAPGLADLPSLVSDVRTAGVPVDLRVEGSTDAVPPGVQLSVYRVVQEALTNVLKHAGNASASVRVQCTESSVEVTVADDGRGAAAAPTERGGHGLLGMRERVGLWGGDLRAGPRPGGGFVVHATMPFGETS